MAGSDAKQLNSAAVIIGIDNYQDQPLSSAVNDALEFQKTLVDLELVKPQDIQLITAPLGGLPDDASAAKIKAALLPFYRDPGSTDRLFFYFAGHGISTFTDEAHNVLRPVLLAQDVKSLIWDGALMIDFFELRDLLGGYGPNEQFFFIDACRDLSYEEYPAVGGIGWGKRHNDLPPANNCQATLFAVAPLGKAVGTAGGQGVMTSHLLSALRSDRLAVHYNDIQDDWQISVQSLAEYVKSKVTESVLSVSYWTRIYMLPELDAPDPQVSPLRTWTNPPLAPLTIHISPDDAASYAAVQVYLRGQVLSDQGLPPQLNHVTLQLRPQRYRLSASCPSGGISPDTETVDVRHTSEITFAIQHGQPSATSGVQPLPALPYPSVNLVSCPVCGMNGRISATANEGHTRVEVIGVEPPFVKYSALHSLTVDLPPGPYQISFRLGEDVFSQGDVYLMRGQEAIVKPNIASTPLVSECLGIEDQLPHTVQISESLGDLQAGLRDLILPIIGLKPFDENDSDFSKFYNLVNKAPPNPNADPWLSIVLAVDGNEWPSPPLDVLEGVRLYIHDNFSGAPAQAVPLSPLYHSHLQGFNNTGPGLERIRLGLVPARSTSLRLDLQSEQFGNFQIALVAGAQRVTVLTLTLQPDGRLSVSQSLMRYPGKDHIYTLRGEPHVGIPTSYAVQQVQLTQDLYRRGDLAEAGWDLMNELAYTKMVELSASCLVFYAWQERLQHENGANPEAREKWFTIANNLHRYFGELPDPEIIYGQAYPELATDIYMRLLETDQVPILAESTQRLATFARKHDFKDATVTRWSRRISANQIWTIIND